MTQLSLCYLLNTNTHNVFSLYKITQHFFGMKENGHDLFVSFRAISPIIKSYDDDDEIIPTGKEKEKRKEREREILLISLFIIRMHSDGKPKYIIISSEIIDNDTFDTSQIINFPQKCLWRDMMLFYFLLHSNIRKKSINDLRYDYRHAHTHTARVNKSYFFLKQRIHL